MHDSRPVDLKVQFFSAYVSPVNRSCFSGEQRPIILFRTFLVLILFLPRTGWVQELPDHKADGNWKQVCEVAKARELTKGKLKGLLSDEQLAKCDETALYYGIGDKPDYAAALQCGWFQRTHPQNTVGNMFYGPGVLTMLYANGRGVTKDYDLAIRFACENDWAADAEMAYRIGHLKYLRDGGAENSSFDLCDDITSGLNDGVCTNIKARMAEVTRSREVDRIVSGLSDSAKAAFPVLQAAERAFEKARVENEVDLSGTSRAAFQLVEEAKLGDQFLINLKRFGKGETSAASEADVSVLDRKLNEAYQRIQRSPAGKWEFGTIKPGGIRETERKWIALVDAWTKFSCVAYPNLSATGIRAQLIRLRLHQLQSLLQ